MNRALSILTAIFIFSTVQSQSLATKNPFAGYKVEQFDSKNGMPNDYVMNTYQSKDGFLWMNGFTGYLRYDGKQFNNFNSSNTKVFKADGSTSLFTESNDSTLWFPTTGSGLISYKKGVFASYLPDYPVLFLMGKTKEEELILNTGGLDSTTKYIVFNPKTKKYFTIKQNEIFRYRHSSAVPRTVADYNWYLRNDQLFHREKDGTFRLLGEEEGISGLTDYTGVYQDSKQRTWLTSTSGLFLWNGKQFKHFPGMEKVFITSPNASFSFLEEDADHGLWLSTGNALAYLPDGSNHFYTFPRQYLNIQTLHSITIDREQNIWLATDRGLFKLSKTKVKNYAEPEGISNNRVSVITEARPGEFLVACAMDSIYSLKDKQIQPYHFRNPAASQSLTNFIHSVTDSKGNIWIGHQTGVLKISSEGETNYHTPNQVRYIVEGSDGRIYFAVAFKGIAYIDESGEMKFLHLPKVDFSQDYISSLHQIKDGSWLITTYRTGARIIDKNGDAHELDLFNGIKGVQVFNALIDTHDAIWFATGKGLVKWHNGKAHAIGSENGLTETALYGILPDKLGNWWFPSNKGIFHAKFEQLEAYLQNNKNKIDWHLIDDNDGMNIRQCVGARHSIVSRDGKVWVLGIGGLVEIDPARLKTNPIPPLLSINSLQVDDSLHFPDGVVISPGNHRYIFDYSALSFVAPAKNQIRFRLVNQDKDWIVSKGDNRAIYTNLGPGDYKFEMVASNNDGVWNNTPAVFRFTIKPFFYQTLWFKILAILFALAIVWLIILWRTRAARAKNIWLEKQVAQRTAELKTSLNDLQSTQKQLIQSAKMASLGELTAGIAHEIQNPLNFVNNFSEVNKELLEELKQESASGNRQSADQLIGNIIENEEKIHHHGKRADAIVKGMLQHSQTSHGQKELTDLNTLIEEYIRLAYHGWRAKDNSFNASFTTDLDQSIGKISVVPQDIGRVLLNILNNGFYAVQERSAASTDHYDPRVTVTTKKLHNKIQIRIADNGNGISDKNLEKIFQPFFTTKPTGQGTGLGLSLSYDIIKAHGGELKVATEEGIGSEFIIELPVI